MAQIFTDEELKQLIYQASVLVDSSDHQDRKDFLISMILMLSQKLRNEFPSPDATIKEFLKRSGQPDSYLAKILGSRSRSSEILSGKRNLSVSDLRVLRDNLGIPPDLLLGHPKSVTTEEDYSKYPIPELVKYNFLPDGTKRGSKDIEEKINDFFAKSGFNKAEAKDACFRQSIRKNEKSDIYALQAWLAAVRYISLGQLSSNMYLGINDSILYELVKLSAFSDGPIRAINYLKEIGINVIIMPHFQKTYLDGAVFKINNNPIIGLTIRYDRIDNFWHTLLHELSHLVLGHIDDNLMLFDDMEIQVNSGIEKLADDYAKQIYVSQEQWEEFRNHRVSVTAICAFASELGISPAIIAGRYRYETGKYKMYNTLVGCGEVRRLFPIFQKENIQ